jgi:hypothetical protein
MADAEIWGKRVSDWRASDLTAAEFCTERGLSVSALRNWAYRLRAAEKAAQAAPVQVVPVTVRPDGDGVATGPSGIEEPKPALTLELGGARIVVPAGFDRATLRAVLDVLGERQSRGAR